MPDVLAGDTFTAGHFPPLASNTQNDSYDATNTTFGVTSTAGTYIDCGASFVAPATGKVLVFTNARLGQDAAGSSAEVAPVVRTGGTVGSGTDVVAASSNNAVRLAGVAVSQGPRYGVSLPVTGLTPGSTYNVRLEHRVSGSTGHFALRSVIVSVAF